MIANNDGHLFAYPRVFVSSFSECCPLFSHARFYFTELFHITVLIAVCLMVITLIVTQTLNETIALLTTVVQLNWSGKDALNVPRATIRDV